MPESAAGPAPAHLRAVGELIDDAPAVAAAFARFAIHTIGDLMRVGGVPLFRALNGAAAWEDVRRWKSVAALVELDAMTLPMARALSAAGIRTVREIAELRFDSATKLFGGAARAAGEAEPTAARVADWLRDAVRLQCGGVVMGTVHDARGKPVAGAVARLSQLATTTDRRGRFRLTRLPLRSSGAVEITAKGYVDAQLAFERPDGYETTAVRIIRRRKSRATGRRAPQPRMLSELTGDRIAPSGWRGFATETVEAKRVPPGEWVALLTINRGEKKARLVSKLQRLKDSKRLIVVYRVPVGELPEGVALGADFVATPKGLLPIAASANKLTAYRRYLAHRDDIERPRLPKDKRARRHAIARYARALVRSGAIGTREAGEE